MEDSGIDSDSKPTASGKASCVLSSDHNSENKDAESCKSDMDQESSALMKDSSPVIVHVKYYNIKLKPEISVWMPFCLVVMISCYTDFKKLTMYTTKILTRG